MFGRREAWPATVLLGIGLLTLGLVLKSAQENMPLEPLWLMGVLVGLYVVLAAIAGGATWRLPVVLGAMLAGHALFALLAGWGYAAVEGRGLGVYDALVHGLWDYLPGTALQFGFACVVGIVTAARLELSDPSCVEEVCAGEGLFAEVPDLSPAEHPQAAVNALMLIEGVRAALLSGVGDFGAGAWERDPQAAQSRVLALLLRTGNGLNTFGLGAVNLLTRSENGRLAALMVDECLPQQYAHALLRELWGVGERLWAPTTDSGEKSAS